MPRIPGNSLELGILDGQGDENKSNQYVPRRSSDLDCAGLPLHRNACDERGVPPFKHRINLKGSG